VVLFVTLLLLIGVTLITTGGVVMSTMELRMAGNVEGHTQSFQISMAAVDYVLADPANLPGSGQLNQPTNVPLAGPPFDYVTGGDTIVATATRIEDCAAPPRMTDATSMKAYSSFRYEASSEVDQSVSGVGRSGMVQGYLQLGPKC
jgi:hypothetical protein